MKFFHEKKIFVSTASFAFLSTKSTTFLLNAVSWGNVLQDHNSVIAVPYLIKNIVYLKKKANLVFGSFTDVIGLNTPANKLPMRVKYALKSEVYHTDIILQISFEILTFVPTIQKHFPGACWSEREI